MAKRVSTSISMDRLLQEMIDKAVEKQLAQILGGSSSIENLRRTPVTLTRLERRVDLLAAKLSGRRANQEAGRARPGRPPIHTVCTRAECGGAHYARGLCSRHYQQKRRAASPGQTRKKS